MADYNALPLVLLAEQFAKLPGIGMKTAQRLAYFVMSMSEEEAQAFTWSLDAAELTHIHILEMGGEGVPKIYTVTELTATTLKYKDQFDSYSFTKVN